jgi:hypothetical protein
MTYSGYNQGYSSVEEGEGTGTGPGSGVDYPGYNQGYGGGAVIAPGDPVDPTTPTPPPLIFLPPPRELRLGHSPALELRVLSNNEYDVWLPDYRNAGFNSDLLAAGALAFDYPAKAKFAERLTHNAQIAVLIDGVEPVNGRFFYKESGGDRVLEGEAWRSRNCPSFRASLKDVLLGPSVGSSTSIDFNLLNLSPGAMFLYVLNNARARNPTALSWIGAAKFSSAVDTSNTAWPQKVDVTFPVGTSLLAVVEWLETAGLAEFEFEANRPCLYVPEKHGLDLTATVDLVSGRELLEQPFQESSLDLCTAVLVRGDDGSCQWVTDAAAIAAYGYRETSISISGVNTLTTLAAIGRQYLKLHGTPRYSRTYRATSIAVASNVPFIDYQPGDWINVSDGEETSSERVRLMSAQWSDSGVMTANITVNDFLGEAEMDFEKRINRATLAA